MSDLTPIVPALFPESAVACGFTTRRGGVSKPPYDSLNLGFNTPDELSAVRENHRILFRFLGVREANAAVMDQVHGSAVNVVTSGGISPATDGIVTSRPGIVLTIRIADCVPLLLYDPVRMAAAAVHCGWRPLAGGVIENVLETMTGVLGVVPGEVIAALGPSAGPCCYEIGGEVAGRLLPGSVVRRDGKIYADLRDEVRQRLVDSGLMLRSIETIPDCTICNESLYFSHRRDGVLSGRMMGYIMIREKR